MMMNQCGVMSGMQWRYGCRQGGRQARRPCKWDMWPAQIHRVPARSLNRSGDMLVGLWHDFASWEMLDGGDQWVDHGY